MRQGLQVNDGGLDAEDEEGTGVSGEKFVVAGADDHSKAPWGKLYGGGVWGDGGLLSGTVGVVGRSGGALDRGDLALDRACVCRDCGGGWVR